MLLYPIFISIIEELLIISNVSIYLYLCRLIFHRHARRNILSKAVDNIIERWSTCRVESALIEHEIPCQNIGKPSVEEMEKL